MAAAKENDGGFLPPVNRQPVTPRAGILQTGLNQVEINGSIYRPLVDAEAMTELILSLALIYNGSQIQQKADRWLAKNTLDIGVFAPSMISQVAGTFVQPRDGQNAGINSSVETLKELHFPGSSSHFLTTMAIITGYQPRTTLPHEIQHFTGWFHRPEDYSESKVRATNLLNRLVPFLAAAGSLIITNSKLGERIHRGSRIKKPATYITISMMLMKISDLLLKPTVDVHGKEKFGNQEIGQLLDENPHLAALNLQALSFQPV